MSFRLRASHLTFNVVFISFLDKAHLWRYRFLYICFDDFSLQLKAVFFCSLLVHNPIYSNVYYEYVIVYVSFFNAVIPEPES